jgi:hypothetical protein
VACTIAALEWSILKHSVAGFCIGKTGNFVFNCGTHFQVSFHYGITSLCLIVGAALTTAHIKLTVSSSPSTFVQNEHSIPNPDMIRRPILTSIRLDFGQPPILFINVTYRAVAAWLSFLGVFWDGRRRMR